jgi:hypothetical protein
MGSVDRPASERVRFPIPFTYHHTDGCIACDLCHSAKQVRMCSAYRPRIFHPTFPVHSPHLIRLESFRDSNTMFADHTVADITEMLWRPSDLCPMCHRWLAMQLCTPSTSPDRSKGNQARRQHGEQPSTVCCACQPTTSGWQKAQVWFEG